MILIRHVVNGWISTRPLEDEDGTVEWLYAYDLEDDADAVKVFARLLRDLNDIIGPSTSRYSALRVRVTTEPGDKYEPLD
jgi:hypothetical protein